MSDRAIRGVGLLTAAFCALLVLIANQAADGPDTIRSIASIVLVVGGCIGAVMLVREYIQNRR